MPYKDKIKQKKHQLENKDKKIAYDKNRYKENAETIKERSRQWNSNNKQKKADTGKIWYKNYIKNKFNLTDEQFNEAMSIKHCPICGKELLDKYSANCRVVDHCHITNKFRGVICKKCNSGIGFLNDDVELLKKAIDYLSSK